MATSGIINFTVTTSDIINYAAKTLGFLGEADQLTPEEYNDCKWFLNVMVKQWIANSDYAPGLRLWKRHRGLCFLASNTGTYQMGSQGGTGVSYWTESAVVSTSAGTNAALATVINVATVGSSRVIPPNPSNGSQTAAFTAGQYIGIQLDTGSMFWTTIVSVNTGGNTITITTGIPSSSNNINNVVYGFTTIAAPLQTLDDARLRDNQGNDTLVSVLSYDEWISLPSKQAPGFVGDPVAVYYEPHLVGNSGQGFGTLFTDVDGAQDLSKYLVLTFFKEIDDFVNPTDEADFSKEWFMALTYGLAKHIAPMFKASWTDAMAEIEATSFKTARRANIKRINRGYVIGDRGMDVGQIRWR